MARQAVAYHQIPVTRRFKRLAALAGLPVVKLHEGRHSAASLARDAAVPRSHFIWR
jgi:hypothetical protein